MLKDSDKFDVNVFSQMCDNLGVDPLVAAKVMLSYVSDGSRLKLQNDSAVYSRYHLALQSEVGCTENGLIKIHSFDVTGCSTRGSVKESGISTI